MWKLNVKFGETGDLGRKRVKRTEKAGHSTFIRIKVIDPCTGVFFCPSTCAFSLLPRRLLFCQILPARRLAVFHLTDEFYPSHNWPNTVYDQLHRELMMQMLFYSVSAVLSSNYPKAQWKYFFHRRIFLKDLKIFHIHLNFNY